MKEELQVSKFKVKFTLKQHTPIIHFQSDQSGATLRATELKPKFDRFLISYVFKNKKSEYQKYLIDKEKDALDYKVKIYNQANIISTPKAYVNIKKETDKTVYQAPYFADVNKSILANIAIKVEFFSFDTELLEIIDRYKDHFFIYENFGTRQNKGFGSFIRSDIEDKKINEILSQHENPYFSLGGYRDYQEAFSKIDIFYKKLKMGVNNPYLKSLLFRYMCVTHNIGWEKKFIKKSFPEVVHGDHQPAVCSDDKEYRYIRAVLGLAEHNEFRPEIGKQQVKIKSKDKSIERFKSPLTFKVFNQKIYILFNNSYKEILDKEFSFTLNKKEETLKTPQDFDMYRFLKFVEKETSLISEVK